MTDMRRIKSRWTKPEISYAVENAGAFPHPDWLPFHPDFAFNGKVVFIDSDFWHCTGKINWARLKPFWQDKLFRNLLRDVSRDAFYGTACGDCLVVLPATGPKSGKVKVKKAQESLIMTTGQEGTVKGQVKTE